MWSEDLDKENQYSDYVTENFDTTAITPNPNGLYKLRNDNQTLLILFPKNLHHDKIDYRNLFQSFMNLQDIIKSRDFTLIPPKKKNGVKPEIFNEMVKFIFPSNNIKFLDTRKIVPKDREEIRIILKECHNSKLSGHCGFNRTYSRVKERYHWSTMKSDIRSYIKTCHSCQINETNFRPTKQPMEITTTSEKPFHRLAIDIVGPLPVTEQGNRFIITAQDDLTKYSFAFAIPNHEAQTIVEKLLFIFVYFGIPQTFLTDQGSDFMSNLVKEVSNLFKTRHTSTTPCHPQTNGALERSHLTLKDYLKHYINEKQTDWDTYITFAMFSYNTAVHKSTRYTPYELLFGQKGYLPSSITQNPEFHYTYDDYIRSLKFKLNTSFQIARDNLIVSKFRSKEYHDKKINPIVFKVNDLVTIENKYIPSGLSKKLSSNAKGPYKIIRLSPNQITEIQVNRKLAKYHTNLLKLYFPDESDNSDPSPIPASSE